MESVLPHQNFEVSNYVNVGKTEDFEFNLFLDNEKCKNIKLEKEFYSTSSTLIEQQESSITSSSSSARFITL